MKKFLALFLTLALVVSLAACASGDSGSVAPQQSGTTSGTTSAAQNPAAPGTPENGTLPIVTEPLTLDVWAGLASRAAVSISNYNEMIAFQEMENRTGIHINWIHPPAGQETEQFQLIMVSGDYPDMMFYQWPTHYVGGPQAALEDGVVLPLGDLISQYAPNFDSILTEYPEVRRDAMTDDGEFYMFPLLRLFPSDRVSGGFTIRQDWLDNLGLDMPTNIDEWETVLTAFKNDDPNGDGENVIPFVSVQIITTHGVQQWASAWGLSMWAPFFMNINGTASFSPAMDEYRDYLITMARWYANGLIDPDFLTTDRARHDQLVTTEQTGAFFGLLNSFMGNYTRTMQEINPDFNIVQAPFPVAPDGKLYNMHVDAARVVATEGFSVMSTNKHLRETVQWLDYFYGEDGRVLMNLGVEGVTFEIVNGEYRYTDLITQDTLPLDQAISRHAPAGTSARLFQDPRYWSQMMAFQNQRDGMEILAEGTFERVMPPITMSPDDAVRFATIFSQVETYVSESFARFVMGQDNVEAGWDRYIETLYSLGLEEALELQQRALDAYMNR